MSSLCSSFRILAPQWRHKSLCFLIFVHSKRNISFTPGVISSSTSEDSVPSPKEMLQLRYDPSEELFGLDVTSKPRFRMLYFCASYSYHIMLVIKHDQATQYYGFDCQFHLMH
ncbi:hypothetical protein CJ030_MR7G000796 [Morella rubra]|uniref:Uncharacterized protein n=1 Tax=Morella rubra TaxID=262757 RepID=A0A6A1V5C1_9ROSI|nr:hypothetical protein CJ030_MR7G000796 [Morella rubra]